MAWWKKLVFVVLGVLIIEGMERLVDYFLGDGDGEILAYHISYYVSFVQFLAFVYLVNWLFFTYPSRSREVRINLILTGCYLIPLVIFEVMFILAIHRNSLVGFLQPLAKSYYRINRPLIQFSQSCSTYDAGLFYLLKPGACTFTTSEFSNQILVNRAGLRDDEESLELPVIISLGDSFAMGWGVEQNETYAQVLEEKSGLRVLNAGVSSYGTARESILLKRLDLTNARYIILQYCFNDFDENQAFLNNDRHLKISSQSFFEEKRLFAHHQNQYFLGKFASFALSSSLSQPDTTETKAGKQLEVESFLSIVKDMRETAPRAQILVMDACSHLAGNGFIENLNARLSNNPLTWQNKVASLDISHLIDDSTVLSYDEHLNSKGHLLVGEYLSEYILKMESAQDRFEN